MLIRFAGRWTSERSAYGKHGPLFLKVLLPKIARYIFTANTLTFFSLSATQNKSATHYALL